jgi:SAM-dependent methyltransferase
LRKHNVAQARGSVLELGVGAGANLRWLNPDQIQEVIGIEPSEKLRDIAWALPFAKAFKLSVVVAAAEELPFDDSRVAHWQGATFIA